MTIFKVMTSPNEITEETQPPFVAIVDDDPSIRRSTQRLFASAGMRAKAFGSVEELLASGAVLDADCLLLDVCLPGMDGLTLQEHLAQTSIPIVFMTARATEEEEHRALRRQAAGFLRKPVATEALLGAIYGAL